MPRRKPIVVSTRVRPMERELLRTIADAEDVSVAETIHRLLVPAARRRLVELADAGAGRD